MQNERIHINNNNNIDIILIHDNGSSICRMGADSFPDSTHMESPNIAMDENRIDDNDINIHIYRFKFMNDLNEELYKFAKIHQYDHRKVFKEAWQVWLEENEKLVSEEVTRLHDIGYQGDIIDKMFKSARYYYRNKTTEKKALATERRPYTNVSKELLVSMDNHIKKGLLQENYKPSDGFDEFCRNNLDLLKKHVQSLCNNGFTDSNEIKKKMKKTYKNRYFLVAQKYL